MPDGEQEGGVTAFRQAEKRYQLHFDPILRNGKRRGTGVKARETDFSGVLDCRSGAEPAAGVVPAQTSLGTAYVIENRPGFCLLPGALTIDEQWRLATDCLTRFTEPPATTNHSAQHGPLAGLWEAAAADLHLAGDPGGGAAAWSDAAEGTPAKGLLDRLRWASVGPVFDWSARRYLHGQPHQRLPAYLAQLATRCAAAAAEACPGAAPGGAFTPDAALVNYYRPGDTLGGHCDDVEADLRQPIVSVSVGCDAVFLLGGLTREAPPLALWLRSGDVVVLAGEARRCFHGVPRVLASGGLPDAEAVEVLPGVQQHMLGRRINVSLRRTA